MSVITTTNGKQRNVLNGKDRFYLQRWVADNAKKLDGLTPEEAATKVFNTIGIHVTPTNLLGARRATGVKFKLRTQPKPVKVDNNDNTAFNVVAIALYDLYRALGTDVPASLDEVIRKQRKH